MDKKDSEEGTGEMAYSSVLSVSTEIKSLVGIVTLGFKDNIMISYPLIIRSLQILVIYQLIQVFAYLP